MSNEWENSSVMSEFLKEASKSGLISSDLGHKEGLGNPTKKTPFKPRNETTEEYGLKIEPFDLVRKSHPKKIKTVDSLGEGGVVENIKEQQKKDILVCTKMPNGALVGVHANLIDELVKLANHLEGEGKSKEALQIDKTINKLNKVSKYYGPGMFHKLLTSSWFLIPALIAAGYTAAKYFGYKLTSMQENLIKDIRDLYDKLIEKSDLSKSATAAAKLISPFLQKLEKVDISTKEGSDDYIKTVNDLGVVKKQLDVLILAIKQDIKEPSSFVSSIWSTTRGLFGQGDYEMIQAKYEDFVSSYSQALEYANKAQMVENNFQGNKNEFVLLGQKYNSYEELEVGINNALENLYKQGKLKEKYNLKMVENGKLLNSPQKIQQIITTIEKIANS